MSEVANIVLILETGHNNLGERIIPDYNQIFRPPPLIHRLEGKKYG